MPEHRSLPLFRWGEELRRDRAARRSGRRRIVVAAIAAASAATGLAGTLLWPPRPLLVWNASASTPLGLYAVTSADGLRVGEMVVARAPWPARRLAAERGYIPESVPLVKRVEAAKGDRVCAVGEAVFINGRLETIRRSADAAARPLPWWTGCESLVGRQIFILGSGTDSFDGRYFGVTDERDVVGRARLLWAR